MLKKQFIVLFSICCFICLCFSNCKQHAVLPNMVFYSNNVKDSFDIKIILPKNYNKDIKYNTVYFLDANIKSGKKLLELLEETKNSKIRENTIFIGIGHIGNFHTLRRRDFLPPILQEDTIKMNTDLDYGHANLFYTFLQNELIPTIERMYNVTNIRSIIGHSFGGLFAYYCMLQQERLFNQFFALSPSLWVDDGNIFNYENQFFKKEKSLPVQLYMANGSLEFLNYVLSSNRKMHQLLTIRNYTGLKITYKEKQYANHNSHVGLTLQEILKIM